MKEDCITLLVTGELNLFRFLFACDVRDSSLFDFLGWRRGAAGGFFCTRIHSVSENGLEFLKQAVDE